MRRIYLAHLTPNRNSTGRKALQNRVRNKLRKRSTRLVIVKGWGGEAESKCSPLKLPLKCLKKGCTCTLSCSQSKTIRDRGEEDEAAILFHSCKWQCKRPATKTAGSGKASIETSAETSPRETLSTQSEAT